MQEGPPQRAAQRRRARIADQLDPEAGPTKPFRQRARLAGLARALGAFKRNKETFLHDYGRPRIVSPGVAGRAWQTEK